MLLDIIPSLSDDSLPLQPLKFSTPNHKGHRASSESSFTYQLSLTFRAHRLFSPALPTAARNALSHLQIGQAPNQASMILNSTRSKVPIYMFNFAVHFALCISISQMLKFSNMLTKTNKQIKKTINIRTNDPWDQ